VEHERVDAGKHHAAKAAGNMPGSPLLLLPPPLLLLISRRRCCVLVMVCVWVVVPLSWWQTVAATAAMRIGHRVGAARLVHFLFVEAFGGRKMMEVVVRRGWGR
jgi:hypothetical protein